MPSVCPLLRFSRFLLPSLPRRTKLLLPKSLASSPAKGSSNASVTTPLSLAPEASEPMDPRACQVCIEPLSRQSVGSECDMKEERARGESRDIRHQHAAWPPLAECDTDGISRLTAPMVVTLTELNARA